MAATPHEVANTKAGIPRSCSSGSLRKRDYDYKFKVTLIGDSGTGKSCLVSTFVNGKSYFSTTYVKTQERDIATKVVEISGQRILLEIWDLSGADAERTITTSHYKNSDALILVYSLTSEDSWFNVKNWFENFRMSFGEDELSRMPKVLVAAKKDSLYTVLDGAKGDHFSFKLTECTHVMTSSRTGENVSQVFMTIAHRLFETIVQPHLREANEQNSHHVTASPTDKLLPKPTKRWFACCNIC